jgi:hypothetical protein
MRPKTLLTGLLIVGLLFISVGDRLLPQPLSDASRNTRTSINRFMLGLFPKVELEKPSKNREEKVKQLEK